MTGRVILIVGPTCVGKTEMAVLLAEQAQTEIVSVDSMQVYRHMDIGTEKPSPLLRLRVKHHMIDIVEPSEDYSTGRYIEDVVPIIEELLSRGKLPLAVGGTGLYIKAMTRGLFKGPSADWDMRREFLEREAQSKGSLYSYLKGLDPEAASRIMPQDLRRTLRAIEVCLKSGKKLSGLMSSSTAPLPYEFIKVGLIRQRKELYGMIENRVDEMFRAGLVDEVKEVLRMSPSRTAMQAIGYKEVAGYLKGQYPLEESIRLIKRNTKRYAKRQFTWFKKEEGIQWVDVTGLFSASGILDKVIEEAPLLIWYNPTWKGRDPTTLSTERD